MIHYTLNTENPHRHYLGIEGRIPCTEERTIIQLPSWRPGRYELGNFAKNILQWKAEDELGNPLKFRKISKDSWEVESSGLSSFNIFYSYYADVLNAGSTFLDEQLLYVNPVNCLMYLPDQPDTEFTLQLNIPESFEIAGSLPKGKNSGELKAKGVQELMDSPFIASAGMDHFMYQAGDCLFHVWICGDHRIDLALMKSQFEAFSEAQIKAFKSIPCQEYHFLFHILPYRAYHGVEHENSTVIALGPASELMEKSFYNELLGVSCHELYHTWNVKNIRPIEMYPYHFERENYTRLGYVAEGVTTYFGDQFLLRSGVFSEIEYLGQFSNLIQKHMDNPGRRNLSVAESSFDTWLDGYSAGVPWRKVSIYNEGALCAFICDVLILKHSNGDASLDDAMNIIYRQFGTAKKGYGELDYKRALEEVAGHSFDEVFEQLIWGTGDYHHFLHSALEWLGWELISSPSRYFHEAHWGFKVDEKNRITAILPDSNADLAGLWFGDEVIAANGLMLNGGLHKAAKYTGLGPTELTINRDNLLKNIRIGTSEDNGYRNWSVALKPQASKEQFRNYQLWMRSN